MERRSLIVLELAEGDFDVPFRLLEAGAAQVFDVAVGLAKLTRSSGSIFSGSVGGTLVRFRNAARKIGHGGRCVVLWENGLFAG
jgi:hypothetical protein